MKPQLKTKIPDLDYWKSQIKCQLPLIVLMIIFSVVSLWLVAQPMEMRTAM